jgi:hypothetical protein
MASPTYSTFTIITSTYTVANTYAYDLYYVDTSVGDTPITITLPTTSGIGGNMVRFMSVTSVAAGDTAVNAVTIQTASASQSIDFTGITQLAFRKDAHLQLTAQDNGATGLWLSTNRDQFVGGIYGDGSDGTVTATTSLLTSDMYYDNLIIPNGVSLRTVNYRVFVRNLLTIQGTGSINNNGVNGGSGNAAVAGVGAVGPTLAYYAAPGAGGNGGSGAANGSNAPTTGTANSVGGSGGRGGNGSGTIAGNGGTVTAVTATNGGVKVLRQPINAVGGFLPAGVRFNVGNGGGGGGGATSSSGGGGGSGAGILLLCARNIVVTGSGSNMTANGGAGGNGGGINGGGGGGGGGGAVVIITQTPNLAINYSGLLTVSANGGIGGAPVGTGVIGSNGNAGNAVVLTM